MVLALLPVGAAKADGERLRVGGTEIDLTQNGSYFDGKVVFEIINGGTVHAKAYGGEAIITGDGIILNNGETYLLGDASASEVKIGILEYPLWVGGVQVTSANQNDVLGDGTVRFEVTEEGENVLTLTNANIGTFHQYGAYEDNYANICCDETAYALTINLVGDNTLSNGNRGVIIGNAFRCDGALTLTGEGTLTVSDVSYGIEANGTLAIDGTTVITDSIKYCAVWGYQVDITGSTVTASGGTFGLCVGAGNLTVTDSTVTATGVEAEGLFLYDSASFGGSSVVIAESTCSDGAIRVHGEITLNDGIKMVTPEGGVYVNTGYGGKKLCLSDGETVAASAVFSKEFTITFVNEDGTELQSGMVAVGETPAYTGETPEKAETEEFLYVFEDWTPEIVPVTQDATYTATYREVPKYPIWVGGVQVTGLNQSDVLEDGTVRFEVTDGGENILTLENAAIIASDANEYGQDYNIFAHKAEGYALTVKLIGTNRLSGTVYGIKGTDLTLTGEGSLDSSGSMTGIWATKDLVIDGTTVTAGSTIGFGIFGMNVTIDNSTVNASGTLFGIASYRDTVITDSTVTATGTVGPALHAGDPEEGNITIGGDSTVTLTDGRSGATAALGEIILNDGIAVVTPAGGVLVTENNMTKVMEADGETAASKVVFTKAFNVTFRNEDGTVLQSYPIAENTVPEYKGEEPEKAHTDHYEYAFDGWTPEIVPVTGDATYTATFTESLLRPTFIGGEMKALDAYIEENGERLYRFDVTVENVLDGELDINSIQIFLTYDHELLTFRKGEGPVDWTFGEKDGVLSAAWASEEAATIQNGDVVLSLYFASDAAPGTEVPVAFTVNKLGNGSALAFVNEGAVLELEARTEDGSILFEAPLWGDANCDGIITSADAAMVLRAVVGLSTLSPRGAAQANVDGDGAVTAADAAMILRFVVGLIDGFPVEEP